MALSFVDTPRLAPLHVAPHPRPPSSAGAVVPHPASPAPEVKLVVAVQKPSKDALMPSAMETLQVMPGETIRDIKLRLRNRGFFSASKHCLVFGDRQLTDDFRVADMIKHSGKASPSYLHVFIKLADLESVSIKTLMRELSLFNAAADGTATDTGSSNDLGSGFNSTAASPVAATATDSGVMGMGSEGGFGGMSMAAAVAEALAAEEAAEAEAVVVPIPTTAKSALTDLLAMRAAAEAEARQAAGSPLPSPPPLTVEIGSPTSTSPTPPPTCTALAPFHATNTLTAHGGRAIVHLMVHKSAKVQWRHVGAAGADGSGAGDDTFELSISNCETVDSLLRKIEAASADGLSLGEAGTHRVLYDGQELASGRPLNSYGIGKGSVLELLPLDGDADDPEASTTLPDGSPLLTSPSHGLHAHWQRARQGLAAGTRPKLAAAGTGGSYFLQDTEGNSVAVFKPQDEEPLAINNPKGTGSSPNGEGLRRGTRPGEGAVREVAAYVLDHDHFAGVPPTALVSCYVDDSKVASGPVSVPAASSPVTAAPMSASAPVGMGMRGLKSSGSGGSSGSGARERKVGSLQQFVVAEGDCEERGPGAFPVHEVHKIAVLDMRLANTDRNGGNILARRSGGEWELVPIDHGYTLPSGFEDITFEWLFWPQAEQPFDAPTLDYIARLDAEKDIALLSAHGLHLRPECLRVLRVCTMLLQKGAAAGLTPQQIGLIMSREAPLVKSPLERLHSEAMRSAANAAAVAASGAVRGRSASVTRGGYGGYGFGFGAPVALGAVGDGAHSRSFSGFGHGGSGSSSSMGDFCASMTASMGACFGSSGGGVVAAATSVDERAYLTRMGGLMDEYLEDAVLVQDEGDELMF